MRPLSCAAVVRTAIAVVHGALRCLVAATCTEDAFVPQARMRAWGTLGTRHMGPNGVLWVRTFWCSWYTWGALSGTHGVLRYTWATRGAHVGQNMVVARDDQVQDNEDRDQARSSLPPTSEHFVQHDLQCGFRFVNLTWRHSKPDPAGPGAWPQAAAAVSSQASPHCGIRVVPAPGRWLRTAALQVAVAAWARLRLWMPPPRRAPRA